MDDLGLPSFQEISETDGPHVLNTTHSARNPANTQADGGLGRARDPGDLWVIEIGVAMELNVGNGGNGIDD